MSNHRTQEGSLGWAIDQAELRSLPLSDIFLERELRESGRSHADAWELLRTRLAVMRASHGRGLREPQVSRSGLLDGGAHKLQAFGESGQSLLGPAFTRLIAGALAVGEVNACMGRVVAAPTAGSCGVLPSVLFTVEETRQLPEEALLRGLLTAGGIGLAVERIATLSGAEGGCQAEVGAASAMAAGALVEMAGGTPRQVGHAVSTALGNVLGLICDPVMGLVEVPCVYRNAMGAANAYTAAEIALAGIPSHFDPDDVIETMGRVGRRLPEDFRETAKGGLATLYQPGQGGGCRGRCHT